MVFEQIVSLHEHPSPPNFSTAAEGHPTLRMCPLGDDMDRTDFDGRDVVAGWAPAIPAIGATSLGGRRPAIMVLATLALAVASAFVGLWTARVEADQATFRPMPTPVADAAVAPAGTALRWTTAAPAEASSEPSKAAQAAAAAPDTNAVIPKVPAAGAKSVSPALVLKSRS
jgi:hypothetical protein